MARCPQAAGYAGNVSARRVATLRPIQYNATTKIQKDHA